MKNRKKVGFVALLISLVLLFAGCSSDSSGGDSKGKSGDTIRIGVLFPLTGPLALLGNDSYDAVQVVADMVNDEGGINGKKSN